jgi:hypothetical protein
VGVKFMPASRLPVQQRETRTIWASAEWKPRLRWLISRIVEFRPSRRPLRAEPDGGEDAVEMVGREAGVVAWWRSRSSSRSTKAR